MYGILSRGRRVTTGEVVSIETPLTLIIGNGSYDSDEDLDYVEPEYRMMPSDDPRTEETSSGFGGIGEEDDFEEVR